jgi:putative transposase
MNEPDRPRSELYKTCKAVDAPGEAHALTFSCFRRQAFLSRDRSRLWTIEAIRRAISEHKFHLWAYVLMPEHVHLLVCPGEPVYSTSAFLKSIKKSVANRAVRYVREHAPTFLDRMADRQPNGSIAYRFWQRARGYDRNLWSPRYIWETIDYIHANPVRRNLCERPEDWIWSSASDYASGRTGLLAIDLASLPEDPRS